MFFSNERDSIRNTYFNSWQKFLNKQETTPLEQQIIGVISEHQEYHYLFSNKEQFEDKDYTPELGQTNPFLHMGLHLAIREQVTTNRPQGIRQLYQQLINKHKNITKTEHLMMDFLVDSIMLAQKNNTTPNENDYFNQLKTLLKN